MVLGLKREFYFYFLKCFDDEIICCFINLQYSRQEGMVYSCSSFSMKDLPIGSGSTFFSEKVEPRQDRRVIKLFTVARQEGRVCTVIK